MNLKQCIFVASMLIFVSSTANAAITLYQGGGDHSDTLDEARNAFIADNSSVTVESFDATFDSGTSIDFPVGSPTDFTATSPSDLTQSENYPISGSVLSNCGETGHWVTFSFVSPISAFGVDIRDVADGGNILNFSLNTGDAGTATTLFNIYHHEFFGVTSTEPFTSITFTWTDGTDCVYWEDLRYGTAADSPSAPVPTLGTWTLIALSMLLGLFGMRTFILRRN